MDRNDRSYFKRITPELIESQFEGHEVPESIRKRVALIMRRFTIFGLCDGMYIANTIAYENGSGDGHGTFEDTAITKIHKIVHALMGAYGCNIFPCDKETLEDIIMNGTLEKDAMLSGLKNSIRIRKEKIDNVTDWWRKEFLYGEINVIKDTIKDEEEAA